MAWSIRFGLAVPFGIAVLALSYGRRTPAWIERSFGSVSLARTEIPTDTGPIRVTVSIGAASLSVEDDPDLESLLVRADTALYTAKHAGRNRVQAALGGGPLQTSDLPVGQRDPNLSAAEALVA